jgi:LysM repeat protein
MGYNFYQLSLQSIIMKRLFWLLALTSAACQSFSQKSLYINVDPVCMDRYEYHINTPTIKGVEYFTYRVRQSPRDFVFLDIGSESFGMQLSVPEDAKDCRNVKFSPELIEKINTGETQLFVVRKDEIGYNVSQVSSASYLYVDSKTLKFKAYSLDFFCNLEHSASGTNLAQGESESEIYFGGEDEANTCLKQYSFRKIPKKTCKPNVDIKIIPEIGFISELAHPSPMNEDKSIWTLVRINDVSIDTYKQKICEGQTASVHMPSTYAVETTDLSGLSNSEVVMDGKIYDLSTNSNDVAYASTNSSIPPTEYASKSVVMSEKSGTVKTIQPKAETNKATPPSIKCSLSSTKEIHIVQQGETLYGIARRYSLSVEQLKAWNKLITNNISPCSGLKISEPTVTPKALKVTKSAEVQSYDAPTVKIVAKGGEVQKQETPQHYTVLAGETVSGLAKKFGYTEERFRKLNNLGKNDALKVGQILKTTDCVCPIPSDYSANSARISLPKNNIFTEKSVPTKPKEEKKDSPKATFKRTTVHIVQADETLESIAARYNISIDDLLTINGIDKTEVLIPSQRLFVD